MTPCKPDFWLAKPQRVWRASHKAAAPSRSLSYLQLGGVGRDVLGNLDHLAFLTDEDPAQAATGRVLAAQTARQEQQQAGKGWRHLCLHICARLLYLKGKNAETSQANSLDGRSAPKAGTNHVALTG